MKNSKLKISKFEKYSLSSKSQTLIMGGVPIIQGEEPNWDPNNPQNATGTPQSPGTTTMNSGTIKPDDADIVKANVTTP